MWFKKFKEWIDWLDDITDLIALSVFTVFAVFLSIVGFKLIFKYSDPSFYELLTSIDENISKCVQILEERSDV